MSIRFAPAAGSAHDLSSWFVTRITIRRIERAAANDNQLGAPAAEFPPVLVKALHHFAQYGLNAAKAAQIAAISALSDGDQCGFEDWLGVTRNFDSSLARQVEQAALQGSC
jgi:hypothetical protein